MACPLQAKFIFKLIYFMLCEFCMEIGIWHEQDIYIFLLLAIKCETEKFLVS